MTMRGLVGAVLGAAVMLASAAGAHAQGDGGYVSILVCKRDAEAGAAKGPEVAFFERSADEVAACEAASAPDFCVAVADIAAGMPCADALAALRRSGPDFMQTQAVHSSRPLLIIAEDVEGEALATVVPRGPHTDMVFMLGAAEGDGGLVGCDFFSRRTGTLTMFQQTADNDGGALAPVDDLSDVPTCAETLTLFRSDGVPLRAKVSVSLDVLPRRPDVLILDEPVGSGRGVGRRRTGLYYVTSVSHSF